MQTLDTIKAKSLAQITNLLEKGKEQPDQVKAWGVTAGGALVGALALTAAANGVLTVVATVAAPPVAFVVGALGGGLVGWNYLHSRQQAGSTAAPPTVEPATTPVGAAVTNDRSTVDAPVASGVALGEPAVRAAVAAETVAAAPVSTIAAATTLVTAATGVAEPDESVPALPAQADAVAQLDLSEDLVAINGIGPVYAGRLRAAGIQTLAQLAELTPERIHEIIGPIRSGHMVEADRWIAEARQLAAQ